MAVDSLGRGREFVASRAWADARAALEQADGAGTLAADDLELLAVSLFMLGRIDDFMRVLGRAHEAYLAAGNVPRAVRCAYQIGVNLTFRGETGQASGWFARAQRLAEREGDQSAGLGYVLAARAMQQEMAGDLDAAYETAAAVAGIGERSGETDLFALAINAQGRIRIEQGRPAEGLALLDEAMLAVTADRLSPIITGVVYCGVISGCEQAFEVRRAREWTDALARWCDDQPDMVAFSGRCRAHRAEIMQLKGAWSDALEESRTARERSERGENTGATGQALYLQGEVLRLRGEFAAAEAAYLDANRHGREPQPGLALLRLAQGDAATAAAALRRALVECTEPMKRARLLPAYAEILLAAGDEPAARIASDELASIADGYESALLGAVSARVRGMVDLAGDPQTALVSLRRALETWQELDAPYESARTRVLLAQACRALGDDETAELELAAAHAVFGALGAAADLARTSPASRDLHGLTGRELEVLRLVTSGRTNREIAAELVVSEHTVARHVQNIFRKLGVSSRAAATAFAFEHDLL